MTNLFTDAFLEEKIKELMSDLKNTSDKEEQIKILALIVGFQEFLIANLRKK